MIDYDLGRTASGAIARSGVEVSPGLISTVTDAVLGEVAAWQSRPLEPVHASASASLAKM